MEAVAGVVVLVLVDDVHDVVTVDDGVGGERQAVARPQRRGVERPAVHLERVDALAAEVEEALAAAGERELDRRVTTVRRRAARELEVQRVRDGGDARLTRLRLQLREDIARVGGNGGGGHVCSLQVIWHGAVFAVRVVRGGRFFRRCRR